MTFFGSKYDFTPCYAMEPTEDILFFHKECEAKEEGTQ